MNSVWHKPDLAEAIMQNDKIFDETPCIVTDLISGNLELTKFVENMASVLTHTEPENREKGMRFYTKVLTELPASFLKDIQLRYIARFYTDRLKEHHSVIPSVLSGFLALLDMTHFNLTCSADFLTSLFREVSCQAQLRQDRYNIYMIIKKLVEKDPEFCQQLGPDLVYGMISVMDGERDPRNLLFLFEFLPQFMKTVPVGHLADEMFDVISCYYPIDFHPSPDDPAPVMREDLANALCPCLCATPEFGEQCLVLLIEKLDSNLRVAKLDSLKLLAESCKTFPAETYTPFIKALWSSITREINHKTDDELKMASHEALSALVARMATTVNTDQSFESFVKGILISGQTAIAEATTVAQFVQATKVLLTTANASKESCVIITKSMVPAVISYYEFKTSAKLKIASLDFLADLYDLVKHWEVYSIVKEQIDEIPNLCLTAVSNIAKEFQVAGFKTLIRVKDVLKADLVLPLVEVLVYNVQKSHDTDILSISVEAVHAVARKYPELIMDLVVRGKCSLNPLGQDRAALQKRLHLLTNLASIDEFTKVIIEDILKIITTYEKETHLIVEVLNESLSMANFYTREKVSQIESDHGLIEPILAWLYKEIEVTDAENIMIHGFTLVSSTIGSLSAEKQQGILVKHTPELLAKCKSNEMYLLIVESLYSSLQQNIYMDNFEEIMTLSLKLCLNGQSEIVRSRACILIAHFLNKVEFGQKFELLYEMLKITLSTCDRKDEKLCPRLIQLYGWLTKSLIMRGSDMYTFWLQKIVGMLQIPQYSKDAADAIRLVMLESQDFLSSKQHCRISLLYKQRMFVSFLNLTNKLGALEQDIKEDYYMSWAYVLAKTPKPVLNNDGLKVSSIIINALEYENKDLLLISLDVLLYLIKAQPELFSNLQTILPRLINLTTYVKSMDVRIKSLECLFEIANTLRTSLLLPFKQDILLDLAPSLDDKKRLVRNMAVQARTRWFMVGAPGENKQN